MWNMDSMLSELMYEVQVSSCAQTTALEYEGDQQIQGIVNSIRQRDLLKALGDDCARPVLLTIINESKSAMEISREICFLISTVYRKIHWLEKANLVKQKGFVISGDGKKYRRYQSRINTVQVSLTNNKINVDFKINYDIKRDIPTKSLQEIIT